MISIRSVAALICVIVSAHCAAYTVKPVNGLWAADSELSLSVGRAINIETGGDLVVVTFYNYTTNGAPTFYVGAGAITATNTANVSLSEPQGGTCLGCNPTSGSLRSSPGVAFFEFITPTSGFVTLPGEQRKAISKGLITRPAAPDGLMGLWVWARIAPSVQAAFGDYMLLSQRAAATSNGNGLVTSADGLFGCELQVRGNAAGQVLCLSITSAGSINYFALSKWFDADMDGLWQYSTASTTVNVFTAKRLVDGHGNYETLKSGISSSPMLEAAFAVYSEQLAGSAVLRLTSPP